MKLSKRGTVRYITASKKNHSECVELISKSKRDPGSLNQYRNENYMDLWKNFKEPICPGDEEQMRSSKIGFFLMLSSRKSD